jgi:hypothetical protein
LVQVNQREVVFTLRQRENDNEERIPQAPMHWIQVVFTLASSGLNLKIGQMCDLMVVGNNMHVSLKQFDFSLPLDVWECMRPFGTLFHGIPLPHGIFNLPSGALPPQAHHVIAFTHEEAAVAKQFGCMRVMGNLAYSMRRAPYPPWIDRDRAL